MTDGRDVFRGSTVPAGRDEIQAGERPAHSDAEFERRARYLAKAASLGQVVIDDEAPYPES